MCLYRCHSLCELRNIELILRQLLDSKVPSVCSHPCCRTLSVFISVPVPSVCPLQCCERSIVTAHLTAKCSTVKPCYDRVISDGFVQERRNSSTLAMELHLSCTNPSICLQNNQKVHPYLAVTGKLWSVFS